ncbi:hypothetical protein NX059_011698 [Plenodomus lindquistii]|nr:hypothetical protein NX059_011698 [Plenodomus lindquistii]
MCGFTVIRCLKCGIETLSTSAKNTNLCEIAICSHNLRQGVDRAPAVCFLIKDEETQIFARQEQLGPCDNCTPFIPPVERGELEHVLQRHRHPLEIGDYDQSDHNQFQELNSYIATKITEGKKLAEGVEHLLKSRPETRLHIQDPVFRVLMARPGPEKYQKLFLNAFAQCESLLPTLRLYIEHNIPNKLFVDTFMFVVERAKAATALMEHFQAIAECLHDFVPSVKKFNGSEATLAFSIEVLKNTLANRDTAYPVGHYLHPDFVMDSNVMHTNTILMTHFHKEAMKRTMKPVKPTAEIRPKRESRKKLSITVHEGVLEEELAHDIEIVHVPFVQAEETDLSYVKDAVGNYLYFGKYKDGSYNGSSTIYLSRPKMAKAGNPDA